MLGLDEAAERVDRCIHARGLRLDSLRQELIQELLVVYQRGVEDERIRQIEQRERLPKTKRQTEMLEFYISFRKMRGYIPSYSQIARHFGLRQRATVAKHFNALRRQGFNIEARS